MRVKLLTAAYEADMLPTKILCPVASYESLQNNSNQYIHTAYIFMEKKSKYLLIIKKPQYLFGYHISTINVLLHVVWVWQPFWSCDPDIKSNLKNPPPSPPPTNGCSTCNLAVICRAVLEKTN